MVPFAGYEMPIQYSSMTEEHLAVRKNVGLFDLSHMGEIEISGAKALEYLQSVTCNDVSKLEEFNIHYTGILNESGCFIDDLLVYRLPDKYLLVVNAANIEKDFDWLTNQRAENFEAEVNVSNRSAEFGLLAIQGPNSEKVMAQITDFDLDSIGYYKCAYMSIGKDPKQILVSRTGYTGEDGFEIYIENAEAARVWDEVTSAGDKVEMAYIGLGARDTLRLEMKMALYGNDIDSSTTPLEAGLGFIVKLKAGEFIGKRSLANQKENGIERKLVALVFGERCLPRKGYPVLGSDGTEIGRVTSGAFSPSLQKPIALAYVPLELASLGTTLDIEIRGKRFTGEVIKPPFYKNASHK